MKFLACYWRTPGKRRSPPSPVHLRTLSCETEHTVRFPYPCEIPQAALFCKVAVTTLWLANCRFFRVARSATQMRP